MASLGSIPFSGALSRFDSAAGFLLVSPPRRPVKLELEDWSLEARPKVDHVIIRFNGATDCGSAHDGGQTKVQRALDVLSILGHADLVTRDFAEEFVVSWREGDRQIVELVSTTTLHFDVPPVSLVVRDSEGNEVATEHPTPLHHPAFRYFRFSQASEDMYDAFRNMYLAFELLLSSQYPPSPGERERDWIVRGLTAGLEELELNRLVDKGAGSVPEAILSRIYTEARLPLFHAKMGKAVLTPHDSSEEREAILDALQLLTDIVLKMAQEWHHARRLGGGVFHRWVYDQARSLYQDARVIALSDDEPFRAEQKDLTHQRYDNAVEFDAELLDDPWDKRAPLLRATVPVERLSDLPVLTKVEVVGEDHPILVHILESPLSLDDIHEVRYTGKTRIENVRHPKSRFSR